MATINWIRLLEQHSVEYTDKGKSTAKGNVYVKCPFCGNADPSHHMGISLNGNAWGCWRNASHRGRSPIRLLMTLFNVSYQTARDMAGLDESYVDPEGYEAIKHNLFSSEKDEKDIGTEHYIEAGLEFPKEFEEIVHNRIRHKRFIHYLVKERGFPEEHIADLCRTYKLRAAVSGNFRDRIIMPYIVERNLVSWTGRAIAHTSLRYLDLSREDSIIPPKHTLYNFNATRRGGKVLLVAEGPFDAVKLDFYGQRQSVRTVALSTNSITDQQTYLLEEVSANFEKVLMVMDNGNSMGVIDSYKLKEQLSQIKNIGFTNVPKRFKDGGEMPPDAVVQFVKTLIN